MVEEFRQEWRKHEYALLKKTQTSAIWRHGRRAARSGRSCRTRPRPTWPQRSFSVRQTATFKNCTKWKKL
eukprot:5507502-Alexandrium_andersonii.AAC.1